MCGSVTKPKESSVIIQTLKTSRTLNDNSQSSFIQKDIRDIIQIDKTTIHYSHMEFTVSHKI